MGKINQGILGGFTGKVGNVVGGNWKGIDYMRVKPSSVANPKTAGQMDQRSKFSTVLYFLQPMKDHIKIGFKDYAVKKTEFNSAMSYNLNNAVIGEYPNVAIDYSKALVSRGNLAPAQGYTVGSDLIGQLQLTWANNSEELKGNATDKAFVLVYNENKAEAISYKLNEVRSDEGATIELPSTFQGESVEVFISFLSEDEKEISNSKYVGTVVISN